MVTSDCRTFALPFSWAYHSSSPPSVPVVAHAPHGTLFGERPAHPGSGRLRCCFEAATDGQEGTTTRQIGGRSGACCTRFLPEGTERCSASERWGEGEPSALTVDTRFDVPHRGPFTVARGNTDDDNHATLNYHPQFPPSYFSPSAQDILHKLLCKDPSRRLGSGPRGAMEIIVRLQTAGHMSTMRGLRWYLLRGDTSASRSTRFSLTLIGICWPSANCHPPGSPSTMLSLQVRACQRRTFSGKPISK